MLFVYDRDILSAGSNFIFTKHMKWTSEYSILDRENAFNLLLLDLKLLQIGFGAIDKRYVLDFCGLFFYCNKTLPHISTFGN